MVKYLAKIISWARQGLRKYPRLRAFIIPWWQHYRDLRWWSFRLRRQPVTYSAHATTIKLYPDGQIARMLWESNFEAYERDFVQAYLRPGMRVLNVGANTGLYTLMASVLVAPCGEVHAFEPSAISYVRLLKNLELNSCRNVITRQVAVSNMPGQLLLRADPYAPDLDGHRFVEQISTATTKTNSDEVVEAITIDDYLGSSGVGSASGINFVVMDVEGAEFAVLQGARQMLIKSDPTLLFECSKEHDSLENLLQALGYRTWRWNCELRRLEPAQIRNLAALHNIIARREGWEAEQY